MAFTSYRTSAPCIMMASMTAEGQKTDFNMLMLVADDLAVKAQKDMNWKKALSGPDRDKVIAAYDKEVKSLLSTILKRLGPDSKKYETQRLLSERSSERQRDYC